MPLLTIITLSISAFGLILLVILASRIMVVNKETGLRRHRSKDEGLADLLNYASVVGSGTIVCKNGALMAAFTYRGDDNASSTYEQRALVSQRINQALSKLGNGWMVHVDAVRERAPGYPEPKESAFPDWVSASIDEERRQLFQKKGTMYEGRFVLTLTWLPPLMAERKLTEMMFDDDSIKPNRKRQTASLISQFEKEVKNIESRLSSCLTLRRLQTTKQLRENGSAYAVDQFLGWLNFCVTGKAYPIVLPEIPIYLDAVIGGQEMWGGIIPKIGRKYIQVVAIDGFPLYSQPGILSTLAEQPCEYRWSNRFIFMDQHEALAHYEKYRKKWRQKVRGFFDQILGKTDGRVDQDALSMVADADAAAAEINSGDVTAGYFTSVVVLMGESRGEVENSARAIEKAINILGFNARVESINTLDAFFGSLPGHGAENVRRPLINTMNLADLIPSSSIWSGENRAPCPMYQPNSPALMQCVTHGATPFRLNLHVRDLGHTLIFGPTGAGKSTLLAILAAQFRRYRGLRVYSFDKGLSLYPLTMALPNSGHYVIGDSDNKLAFCPLQFLESKSDRAFAMNWIDGILELNGLITTPEQRNSIADAITSMGDSGAKTLTDFCLTVQDKAIREALKQYTVDGSMGHLLDAESDSLSLSSFTTFEIEELMNLGEKYALPVLLYLFRRIERSLDGTPTVLFLDEAWILLGHPVFREKIREWLKVLRKANCIVILATQNLSDAKDSGILDVLVESTATKIFLPNPNALDEEATALYRRVGLNSHQAAILASAIQKRQYYYSSEKGRRLFELALGPFAMAFVGSSSKEDVAEIKQLISRYGRDGWQVEWLKNKGVAYEHITRSAA